MPALSAASKMRLILLKNVLKARMHLISFKGFSTLYLLTYSQTYLSFCMKSKGSSIKDCEIFKRLCNSYLALRFGLNLPDASPIMIF